jgi:hypothetical protein
MEGMEVLNQLYTYGDMVSPIVLLLAVVARSTLYIYCTHILLF